MSGESAIEWTDATWNPTTGCDKVSPGCYNCYALTLAKRLKGMGSPPYQEDGDPRTSGPGFLAHEWPSALEWPLHQRAPRRIFVNSMSDLFHKNITDEYIAKVFGVMARCPQHTFQVLTKRHGRMKSLLNSPHFGNLILAELGPLADSVLWPLSNVWLGVSVESQEWADVRIPALLGTPAMVRFISAEPLLGPISLDPWLLPSDLFDSGSYQAGPGKPVYSSYEPDEWSITYYPVLLNWVIAGGESGPGARPMQSDWAQSLRDQCTTAGVPFLFKQWGGRTPKAGGRELDGRTWEEYPVAADPSSVSL